MKIGEAMIDISELDSWQEAMGLDIRNIGEEIFAFGYQESELEIQDALDYSEEDWPSSDMSERQLDARRTAPGDSFYFQTKGEYYA